MDYFSFWNRKLARSNGSTYQQLHEKWFVQVPGYQGDKTDRGQPKRFDKWYKRPRKAHRLFWRFHQGFV